MKVYIVIEEDGYNQECIEEVFSDKENAEKYCSDCRCLRVEEWEVINKKEAK